MRLRLLFVSPVFLFPATTGGRIRTSQILRGMKGGAFELTLASPASPGARDRHAADLSRVCDRFVSWPERRRGPLFQLTRMRHLFSRMPIPVATDRTRAGSRVVARELESTPDVVVFDFLHSLVLAPPRLPVPSVLFTHNVEAEIFRRHIEVARSPWARALWHNQYAKMERLEKEALARFDTVVAVSERDSAHFRGRCGHRSVALIPTGVDLDYFDYAPPGETGKVVFTGSMDWRANIDGMHWLLDEVWPLVVREHAKASMVVIGRNPPSTLVRKAAQEAWTFTGFVDDIRDHMRGASACVIPLRVGGGTRIKAFEAMAQGCPVVSTTIGVEGLPLEPERHYLRADTPSDFAAALLRLLRDGATRERLSRSARAHVEDNYSCDRVAAVFEQICAETASRASAS